MLGYDDRIKLRDALLESTVLQNAASVKDEIDEIKFSDIYDKAKDDHTDTNIDKPTVDEPSDIDLFDEGIDYSDFIEFDDKDEDKMFSSNDIDDIIAETDKIMKALTESDQFEDNIEALFESDENFGNIDESSLDGLTESFDGLNESILNDDIDLDGLTESVILEEAEAYAMLDELSEQIIRDRENSKGHNENNEDRLTGLYEDDDELLPVDDDLDGEPEDYIDPEDVKLVDQYLNDEDDEFIVPVDDEPDSVYDENPEADVDGDGIPDIDEPHGELPEDYEPSDYDEYDHGYVDDEELGECNSMNESEDFTESDDLSFLFESDDESGDDDDSDDSDDDEDDDTSDDDSGDENDDEDEDEDDDDNDDSDEDDEEDDDEDEDEDESDDDSDDSDDDEDDDTDEDDEDDDEFDISFDEKEEE